jgi:hypothetical protein
MPATPPIPDRASARSRRASYDAYLNSRAWSDNRKQWYAAWLTAAGVEPSCLVCGRRWTLKAGHLHHVTYDRLDAESVRDLLPLCRRDHRALHAIIDSHPTWQRTDRRTATAAVIVALRQSHAPHSISRLPSSTTSTS